MVRPGAWCARPAHSPTVVGARAAQTPRRLPNPSSTRRWRLPGGGGDSAARQRGARAPARSVIGEGGHARGDRARGRPRRLAPPPTRRAAARGGRPAPPSGRRATGGAVPLSPQVRTPHRMWGRGRLRGSPPGKPSWSPPPRVHPNGQSRSRGRGGGCGVRLGAAAGTHTPRQACAGRVQQPLAGRVVLRSCLLSPPPPQPHPPAPPVLVEWTSEETGGAPWRRLPLCTYIGYTLPPCPSPPPPRWIAHSAGCAVPTARRPRACPNGRAALCGWPHAEAPPAPARGIDC